MTCKNNERPKVAKQRVPLVPARRRSYPASRRKCHVVTFEKVGGEIEHGRGHLSMGPIQDRELAGKTRWKAIGVELTEGMMMEPEASVSAIVFHDPDCAYF